MFSRILKLRFFFTKFYFSFFRVLQSYFFVIINSYIGTFDSIEKQNKENFVKKILKFVDSGIVKTCVELDLNEMRQSRHCDVQSR